MRILIVIDYYQPQLGYSETYIARELSKQGHQVAILTSNYYFPFPDYDNTVGKMLGKRQLKQGIYKEGKILIYRRKLIFEKFARCWFQGHEEVIKKVKPDIVIANKITGLNTWKTALLKSKYHFKLVCYDSHLVSEFGHGVVWLKKVLYFLFRVIFLNSIVDASDKIIAVQEGTIDIIKNVYGIKNRVIDFIPLGTDIKLYKPNVSIKEKIRKQLYISKHEFVIIYSGKIIPAKGIKILFDAFNILINKYRELVLLIVGDGTEKYRNYCLSAFANKEKNRIVFTGMVPSDELYKYYNASDVAVWPLQESTSMNDAAACGLPFIANNEIGTHLRISNNNALLYKKGDVYDLSRKIEYLIRNKKERLAMGERGRKLMVSKLSWKTMAKQYLII